MANKVSETQVVTGKVRLSFVSVFEPSKVSDDDKEAKYRCTIIIPKEDTKTVDAIKAAIQKAAELGAQKHFGGRVPTNVSNTLKDGDTETNDVGDLQKEKYPEYAGCYYMRLSTKYKPKVLDANKNEILDPTEVYSGCYGRVSLTCFAYSGNGKRGVSACLNNVQKLEDGEPLTSSLNGDEFGE